MNELTPGARLRKAVDENNPLQVVGTINAYSAIMAEKVGHKAIYLSGGGVAACSFGTPDLGITTMKDVLEDVLRITDASSLLLLVDIDEQALSAARAELGTATIKDTVNESLRAAASARAPRVREALAVLAGSDLRDRVDVWR